MRAALLIAILAGVCVAGCLPLRVHRDETYHHFAYAVALEEAGESEQSVWFYNRAAELAQRHEAAFESGPRAEIAAISLLKLGRMNHEQGRLEEALDYYAKARDQMAYNVSLEAQLRRSTLLASRDERKQAAQELHALLNDERMVADPEHTTEAAQFLAELRTE